MMTITMAAVLTAGTLAAAEPLACPAELARDGARHRYAGISVLNVDAKGTEFDLAPDDGKDSAGGVVTQLWYLKNYRDLKVVLRCRYRGTAAVTDQVVPAGLATCAQSFRLDRRGERVGEASPGGCR